MVITVDVETCGLDPRADRLVLVGAQVNGQVVILRHDQDREHVQRILNLDARFCGHNIGFDMAFLEHAGYRIPDASRWIDTTLLAHIAGERKAGNTRLSVLAANLIKLGKLPEDTLEPERALNAWLARARRQARKDGRPEKGHAPRDLLDPYLRADVQTTHAIACHYAPQINGQGGIVALEHACLEPVYMAERRGVPIDVDAAVELRDRTAGNVRDLRARVFDLAGHPFNLNSARQIEKALLDAGADLEGIPRTEKAGLPMFTAQTLAQVDHDLARALEAYRDEKALADYVHNLYAHTHGDRLYGTFNQVGTETGRMASSRPNLQNIPKSDLRVRYVIRAAPGRALVGADLDSVELRVLASYARGGRLEQAFADGADLHQQTADAIGVERDVGKTINYAVMYGAGIPRISTQLRIERDEAKQILDRWYRTYPEVTMLKANLTRTVRRRGYLLSVLGRRHYFDQPNHMLLNRLISGSCADLFKQSIVQLHRAGAPMILFVHDEIVCDVDQDDAERIARLLETELTRPAYRPGIRIDGLVANATVAERWSDFKQPGYTPELGPAPPVLEPAPPAEQLLLGEG